MPMIEYMKISKISSEPTLAIEAPASVNVLKITWSFLNFLKSLKILPILSERMIVAWIEKFGIFGYINNQSKLL